MKIENVEYCIHKSMLRKHAPDWLATLMDKPQPITLENTSVLEFDALLSILYPA